MSWAHETLIQLLDSDLLPVYLDILQILKSKVCSHDLVFYHCSATVQSKLCSSLLPSSSLLLSFSLQCPVLVEQMVHSSLGLVGGEAFSLLLKRPWNPVVGMTPVDRLVGNLTPATYLHTSADLLYNVRRHIKKLRECAYSGWRWYSLIPTCCGGIKVSESFIRAFWCLE